MSVTVWWTLLPLYLIITFTQQRPFCSHKLCECGPIRSDVFVKDCDDYQLKSLMRILSHENIIFNRIFL